MKYKVCVISSLYPPYTRGGAEKIAELTTRGLQENGHKVFIVTTNPWRGVTSLFPKTSKYSNTKIYRFYPLNIFSFLYINKQPFFLRLIWRVFDTFNLHSFAVLWYILKKEMPDAVWTHNLTGIGLLTPFLLKILKISHIHTLHDVSLIEPSGVIIKGKEKKGFLIRLFFGSITRRLFGSPALVVSPSKWLLDFYLKHGFFKNSKTLVKRNPVFGYAEQYHAEFGPASVSASASERILKQVQNDKDKILNLLYLGQLEIHKGILFLISVLNELAVKYKFKLFIVGTGQLFNHLKKIIEKKSWAVLCGKLDSEDLKLIWKEVNITLVPSLTYENAPTVIYESLISGVPVVASRIGGIPELVKNGENGFLFEPGNKEELKNQLVNIFKNPRILENLSHEALTFKAKSPKIYIQEVLNTLCQN